MHSMPSLASASLVDSFVQAVLSTPQRRQMCLAARSLARSSCGYDVVGLAQAMVDFGAAVEDSFLDSMHVEKGGRR